MLDVPRGRVHGLIDEDLRDIKQATELFRHTCHTSKFAFRIRV